MESIIYLMANAFGIYNFYNFSTIFRSKSKVGKPFVFLSYAAFYLLNSSLYLIFDNPLINVTTSIVPLILISFLYDESIGKKCIVVFGSSAIAMSTDVLMFSVAKLLGIPPEIPQMNVQNVILMFFFVQIIKSIVKKNKFISLPIKITHYIALLLIPLGSLLLGYFVLKPYNSAEAVIAAAFLLVINLFVFWLLNEITEILAKNYENEILQNRAESYKNELETLKQSEKRISFLRHDMKNHLLAIRHFYESKDYDKIPEYIDTAVLYISPQTAFSSSGNTDIDSILNYKLGLAADLGIKIKTDITIPEELGIGTFELSVILNNLIDNAVTAAQNAKEKLIEVSITYNKNTLLIAISNTFNPKNFNDFTTTKSDKKNHGLGLQSVRDIVDRNDGIFGVEQSGDLVIAKVAFMLK